MTTTITLCEDCQRSTNSRCWRHPRVYYRPRPTAWTDTRTTSANSAICPDLLRYEQIGAADGLRGRVVRAVFWLLRAWPPRR